MILDTYARESAAGDKRNVSITGQHDVLLSRVKELGATLGKPLDDKGKSAWVKGVRRPGWEELIYRGEHGLSDGVVIFDIERLLRRVEDALLIHKLAQAGFRVYDSDMAYDLTTASGEAAFWDAAKAAQYYAHRLSDRVKRGNERKATRGEGRSGRYRPFAFEKVPEDKEAGTSVTLRVYEPERPYGEEIARRWLSEGQTWQEICDWLTSEGLRTGAGNPWSPTTLRNAMKSPRMAGFLMSGSEIVGRLPGKPVLDPPTWMELCQKIQGNRGRPSKQNRQTCSGLIYCANCDQPISARCNLHGKTYADGTAKKEYCCKMKPPYSCGKQIADQRALDEVIGAVVVHRLIEIGPDLRRRAEDRQRAATPHQQEIKRLEDIRSNWAEKSLEPGADATFYQSMITKLDERLKVEREAVDAIEGDIVAVPAPEEMTLSNLKAAWNGEGLTPERRTEKRRRMIKDACQESRIYVAPGSTMTPASEVRTRVRVEAWTR